MKRITGLFLIILILLAGPVFMLGAQSADAGPTISAIQGAGHISPFKRENVEGVRGIVTVVAPGHGFFMESPEPDDDPATSEGIYVTGYRLPAIRVGDLVTVAGRVDENYAGGPTSGNLPVTKILRATVEVVSHGHELPEPVVFGREGRMPPTEVIAEQSGGLIYEREFLPEVNALDFYESVEGMRVQLNNAVSVGTVHTTYGEIWVLPDGGAGASVRTPRGGIVVREGDFNPERVLIDYLVTPSIYEQDPVVLPLVGDLFSGPIVGVMGYDYGNYKLQPVGQLPAVISQDLEREVVEPVEDEDVLSVAGFNVYNLSPRDEQAKFDDLALTIVEGLAAPDIVVLSEVQDGDGTVNSQTVSSQETAAQLITAIMAAGGPSDYAYTDVAPERNRDGGAPGGNIRVGFLYREGRVDLVLRPGADPATATEVVAENGSPTLSLSPGRVDPENRVFASSRKPVVAEFRFNGQTLFVIGNHFNSKGGDGYLFGQVQPPTFNTEVKRAGQAESVRTFVESILAVDPEAFVIVAGDLNDFAFSNTLRTLEGADNVLLNLGAELLPGGEIYSYIYEGNSQALDHILVSPGLFETGNPTVDYVHRYCEYLYEERHSDHDPVLARFTLP